MTAVRIDLEPGWWWELPRNWPAGSSADRAAWSREVALRVWRTSGQVPPVAELDRLSATIAELAQRAQGTAADRAYLLLRDPADVPLLMLLTIHPAVGGRVKALRQLVRSGGPADGKDAPEHVTRFNSPHLGQGLRARRPASLPPGTGGYMVDYAFRSAAPRADVHLSAACPAPAGPTAGTVLLDLFAKSVALDASGPEGGPTAARPPAPDTSQNPLQPIWERHQRYARDQQRARRVLMGHRIVIIVFAISFSTIGIIQDLSRWHGLPFFVWLWTLASFGSLAAFWLCRRPQQRAPRLMFEIQSLAVILLPLTLIGALLLPFPGALGLAADATTLTWTGIVRRRERPHARR